MLHEEDLAVALHNFVEKDEKVSAGGVECQVSSFLPVTLPFPVIVPTPQQALHDLVQKSLQDTAKPMLANMQVWTKRLNHVFVQLHQSPRLTLPELIYLLD